MNLITLTTDFGLKDPFAGMMKGVIYSINKDVNIVDISHGIGSQDIIEGAFVIGHSYRYFPKNTIHVVVVDPGVGSRRRPVLVTASGHYFIGPDNGVLSVVIAGNPGSRVFEITAEQYFLRSVGATFQGRDVFAPVAAWLAKGGEPHHFGREISDYASIEIPKPIKVGDSMKGEVIYIDRFGNLITNITYTDLEDMQKMDVPASSPSVRICGIEMTGIKRYYAEAEGDETAPIINSFGLLEIYRYMGDASKALNAGKGDAIEVQYGS